MKKILLLSLLTVSALSFTAKAQEKDPPLTITGSVDAYFRYDFADQKTNIPTSFASDQNSMSIGMVYLALKKKVGKASFVGEVSFGPRNDQSLPVATNHIQNLYMSYDVTPEFNLTGGYMGTFVGYEVINAAGNFNYSTSYLFTNGPFQNAGIKATYMFSPKASLMAGFFNDQWNVYTSKFNMGLFGAQLMVSPVEGWTAYINLLTQSNKTATSGTVIDVTTAYQITKAFKLGLNAADYTASNGAGTGGYSGIALYPQYAVSDVVTFGLRGEYFKTKTGTLATFGPAPGKSVTALTVTANVKAGPLVLIPEVRFDTNSDLATSAFLDRKGIATKSASQFAIAAVYAF